MNQPLPARQLSGDAITRQPSGLYPARTPLDGVYARLEPLHPEVHVQELWEASSGHDTIWDFLAYGPFASPELMLDWLRGCAASPNPIFYAIRDGRDGKAAGMASYLNTHPAGGSIEIGHIWFAPSLQKSREATEALFLLMRYAMDDLSYRRLEWKCNALNAGSRAAAARLGFAFEGIFYQHTIVKGRNRDTAWFSILDGEWPAIRANFAVWLAPTNFDADNEQIVSLGDLNRRLRPGEGR